MPVFKAGGIEWLLALDAPKVRAVQEQTGVRLTVGRSAELDVFAIVEDPLILPEILWVLCREQAEARNLNREQFAAAVVGDLAEDAGEALIGAILDFIPSRSLRRSLREAWERDRETKQLGHEIVLEEIPALVESSREKMRQAIRDLMRAELPKTPSSPVTDSPASSESAPTG